MTWEEFQKTRVYVEKKALNLMSHEKKNDTPTGVPVNNYRLFHKEGRTFYSVQINTFMVVADDYLREAQLRYPEKFGTGNAYDVIEALRLIQPLWFRDAQEMAEFLAKDKCTYVFESEGGEVIDRMLRLDLFRMIKNDKKGNPEFIGGLLHALKHFSKDGINYSTGSSNHELHNTQTLVGEIINAFFTIDGTFETPDQYVVLRPYENDYNLKFVFYREANTGVFFLKTVYKEPKKKV
jgi:hypothetical protein